MKCANCASEAVYTAVYKSAKNVNYCASCLPVHLRVKAYNGELPLDAPQIKKSRKKVQDEDIPGTGEAGTPSAEPSLLA